MKEQFPEYYYDFKDMWNRATFVFDANVLLNVYRFSPSASDALLAILERLKDRIWIPYQFAEEYHKNLHHVDNDISAKYSKTKNEIDKIGNEAVESLRGLSNPTSFNISQDQFEAVQKAFQGISEQLSGLEKVHARRVTDINIRGKISELFGSRVGRKIPHSERKKIFSEGNQRYDDRIPPGFKDKDRNKSNPYGDLIGWKQIVEYARSHEEPIIMITDDSSSDDWFHKVGDEAQGPRRELVDEIREQAKVDFYLYQTWELLQLANAYLEDLEGPVTDETIAEAKRLSEGRRRRDNLQRIERKDSLRHERERSGAIDRHRHRSTGSVPPDAWLDDFPDFSVESAFENNPFASSFDETQGEFDRYREPPSTVDDIPF